MREFIRGVKRVSSLLVFFSVLRAFEDGCMVNVLIAIMATAAMAYTSVLEG